MRELELPIYARAMDRISFKKFRPSAKPESIAFGSVAVSIAEWLITSRIQCYFNIHESLLDYRWLILPLFFTKCT
jgi:hypothetical protein